MLTEESLLSMSRKDIMNLAKDRGLKANQATAILMKQLLASNEDVIDDKENVAATANEDGRDEGITGLEGGVSKISLSPQPRGNSLKNGNIVIDSASSTPVDSNKQDTSMQLEDTPIMADTPITPARMNLDDLMSGDAVEVYVDEDWIPGVLKKLNKKTARVVVFNENPKGKEITVAYPDEIRIPDEEEGTWKGVKSVSPLPNKTKTPLSSNKNGNVLSPSELTSPIITETTSDIVDAVDEKKEELAEEKEEEEEVIPTDTSNIDEEWKGDVIEAINDWAACASPLVDVKESTEDSTFAASTRANNKTPKAVSMSARTSSTTVTKSSRKSSVGGKKKASPKTSPKIASPVVANISPKNSTKKSRRKSSGRRRRSNSSPIIVDAASIVATDEGRMSLMKDLCQEKDTLAEQETIPAPEIVSVKAATKVKASSPVQKKISSPVHKTTKAAKKKTSPIAKTTATTKSVRTATTATTTTAAKASVMNVVPIEKRPSKHDRDYEVAELPPPSNNAHIAPPKLTKGALLMMESRKKAAQAIEAKQALEKKEKEGKFIYKTIAGASGNTEKKAVSLSYIPRVAYIGTHNVHSVTSPPNIVFKHDERRSSGIVPIHQSRRVGFKTGVQKKPIDTLNTLGFTCHTNEEQVQYTMEKKKLEGEYTKEKISRSEQQRADERRMALALAHRQRMDKDKDTITSVGNKKVFKARSMPNFSEKHEKGPKFKLTTTSNSRQVSMQPKKVVKKADATTTRPMTAPAAFKTKTDTPPAKKITSKVPFANITVTASTEAPRTSRASSNVSTVSAVSEQSSCKISKDQNDSDVNGHNSPIEKDGERRRSLRRRTPAKNPFETIAN